MLESLAAWPHPNDDDNDDGDDDRDDDDDDDGDDDSDSDDDDWHNWEGHQNLHDSNTEILGLTAKTQYFPSYLQ